MQPKTMLYLYHDYGITHNIAVADFDEIVTCDITDIKQLRKQEGKYVKVIKPELNVNVAGRSLKEYNEDNKDRLRLYRKLYYRTYRELHKEYLKQYRKNYYLNKKSNIM